MKSIGVLAFVVIITFIIVVSVGCVEEERKFGNMKISCSEFENGEAIPSEYTCDGSDVSPPLTFSEVPEDAKSLALIMDDPDAPMGTWVHWLVWNILPTATGFAKNETIMFPQGRNDFGNLNYGGPCPPSGTHHYYFKLYALDTMLDLTEGSSKKQLEDAMKGHIIEEAQLIGTYRR